MADFHFIRPEWLFAIPLIFIIVYLLKRLQISNSGWQQVIPPHLAQKLIDGDNHSKQGFSLVIPALLTLLAIIALAGPAWQKLPQPVYNVQKGAVIIMDMSNSMYATDLSPNRLTRARYKAIDLLEKLNEGDIGLIAYAGDSFTISPLTEDINNIKLLLPALSPQLMPVQGSNPLLALTMANDMLINAGHINGDIYWLTDDVDQYDVKEVTNFASSINHSINILGIGTNTGAPIKMPDGQLLKDDSGAIVLPQLTEGALAAIAQRGRGAYQTIRNNSDDINTLVNNANIQSERKDEESQLSEGDQFKEAGPYLILLILPLMLGYFRRGNLLAILPCLMFFSHVPDSYAQQALAPKTLEQHNALTTEAQTTAAPSNTFWQDLWQTQDQQAQEKYNQEQYDAAAKQFSEPMWQGSAHYKNGNFEQALKSFQQSDSAEALYNQGNSLAKLQKLDEAIKAYEQVLAQNPDFEAAKTNKALLEQLKEQQEQQEQQQNQNQDQDKNSDNSDESQQDQKTSKHQQDQNNQQQSNDQQADNQQQQNDSESDEQQDDQQEQNQQSEQEQQDEQSSQDQEDAQQKAEEQAEQESEQDAQAQQNDDENGEEQQAQAAQLTEAEQAAKEEEQKHQQLLKKVTDDPYLLLRNKMQLEYQKRRNQTSGVNKKW